MHIINIKGGISCFLFIIVIIYGMINKKGKKSKNMLIDEQKRVFLTAKVGPKGQITIPKEIRDLFEIKEGETLVMLADKKRGIAILKTDEFYKNLEDVKHE
jgi:AbrB family looped-hinge helix DNA binding protein